MFVDYQRNRSYATVLDTCQVNNGNCDANARCSHDGATNAIKCTCKQGFVNVGSGTVVICNGELCNLNRVGVQCDLSLSHHRWQIRVKWTTEHVMLMRFAHMCQQQTPPFVLANQATQIRVVSPTSSAKVHQSPTKHDLDFWDILRWSIIIDSCQVNNGGCAVNSICSHDATTNVVKCTCKPGFTNTASGNNVTCTGKLAHRWLLLRTIRASSTHRMFSR